MNHISYFSDIENNDDNDINTDISKKNEKKKK